MIYHRRMTSAVRVDFSRPIALFPLPSVVVYPHTAEWMVAFEPRYRQLIEDCLRARTDGDILSAAPIAMCTYASRQWEGEKIGEPALRPAACVVKIVDHRALADGRHQVLVHGVSRANIETIAESDGRRLYRLARLQPLDCRRGAARRLPALEGAITQLLSARELKRMQRLDQIRNLMGQEGVPTEVIVEQLLFVLSHGDRMRYDMLAEPNARARARVALSELAHLAHLLDRACESSPLSTTRGVILN